MSSNFSMRGLSVVALLLASPTVTLAQTANASTAATGLGGAFTARAQGYNAVNWNPANLAMPGNPGFSFTMLAVDGQAGMRPIDLKRIANAGSTIDAATREQWLVDIENEGTQNGGLLGGATHLGFNVGSFGFQLNTNVAGETDLSAGAAEALLFGNEGRTGSLRALDLRNSRFNVAGYSTGAIAYGMRLPIVPLSNFAIGLTGKYTVGHAVGIAQNLDSQIGTGNQIDIEFPYIRNSKAVVDNDEFNIGSGIGFDLGAAWTIPGFRFGVSMQNIVNTFKWDTTKLASYTAVGAFSGTQDPEFDAGDDNEAAYATAPAILRERIANQKFKPVFAAGLSFDWLPRITVSADLRHQVQGGIEAGPESVLSAGAEARWIPFLPLRGGIQMMTGGFGVAGGVGLRFLGLEAGLAGYVRTRNGAEESGATINFISVRP
jgi:hypothetical protein